DVHPLSFELVCDLGAFLHHGDYVQTTLTDLDNLMRIGEPSVKELYNFMCKDEQFLKLNSNWV
ncbi:hypothetical protein LOB72_09945, partial [Lactobacillus delbrueckii subsp. lactis]|uniref:hypothetical protein n=1 Tax=Lactobacillus delbrueckii TaxID=1584 RepID=UPI001E5C5DF5